jgi:hypothetical protein
MQLELEWISDEGHGGDRDAMSSSLLVHPVACAARRRRCHGSSNKSLESQHHCPLFGAIHLHVPCYRHRVFDSRYLISDIEIHVL